MTTPETEEKDRKRGIIIFLLLLLLLSSVGLNIYLYRTHAHKEAVMNTELVSVKDLRAELQKQLDSARTELSDYKGRTDKMDNVIQQKESDLMEKAQKIEHLLKDNKITYNKYIEAKDEIDKWKYYAQKYLKQVDDLSAENKKLSAENEDLNKEVKKNKKDIDQLTDANITLNNKVSLGEEIKANNIQITGVRIRGNGKEHETNRASQIEKIKICFDIPENHIADNGNKNIYIKVTDPESQPVVIESLGSGKFELEGKESSYTSKEQVFYDNMPKNYCIYWGFAKDAHLKVGTYTIELYTDGYKMGEKNFSVK